MNFETFNSKFKKPDILPNQPRDGDVILGGNGQIPKGAVILGGIIGKEQRLASLGQRLESGDLQTRVDALNQAANYSDEELKTVYDYVLVNIQVFPELNQNAKDAFKNYYLSNNPDFKDVKVQAERILQEINQLNFSQEIQDGVRIDINSRRLMRYHFLETQERNLKIEELTQLNTRLLRVISSQPHNVEKISEMQISVLNLDKEIRESWEGFNKIMTELNTFGDIYDKYESLKLGILRFTNYPFPVNSEIPPNEFLNCLKTALTKIINPQEKDFEIEV
jgi:hypothetical protein